MKEKSQMIEKLELALEKQQDGMTSGLFDGSMTNGLFDG